MEIVIATGAGKTGKQIIMEEMRGGVTVIEVGHRGANKTPVKRPDAIIFDDFTAADFTALEERVIATMQNEVYYCQPLERLVRPYQRIPMYAVATVHRQEKKKKSRSVKSKAKGPRNRWGGVK